MSNTYIAKLQLNNKVKGSQLRSEEWNLTVDTINLLIDKVNTQKTDFSGFIEYDDISYLIDNYMFIGYTGDGIILRDSEFRQLLPATNASYVFFDDEENLVIKLETLNSKINNVSLENKVDNRTIYVNEHGKLVVNGEEVLHDALNSITFVNERGEWVGPGQDIKQYIDNSYNTLRDEFYTTLDSSYVKFDNLGTNFNVSEEFITKNTQI